MPEETVSIVAVLRDKLSGGLKTIRSQLLGIREDVNKLKGVFAPLTSQFATFAAGFAGIQGIRRAIAEATQAEDAAQRLRSALGANVDKFKEIVDLADEVQEKSTFDNDQIVKLAATLLERGVALADIQKTIKATVETTAALGGDLESRGEQIARMFGGTVPRELGFAVAELKTLDEQALKTGKGIDLLGAKFAGRAKALADTDLGKIKQQEVAIGNAFEDLGRVFIKLEAIILPAIARGFERLSKDLSDDAPANFLKTLANGIAKLLEHLPELIKFFLALKVFSLLGPIFTALTTSVSILAGALTILLSPLGLILAGVIALTAAIIDQTIGWKKFLELFKPIVKYFQDLFNSIKNGEITIGDLVDFIVASTKAVFTAFKGYTYDPIKLFFTQLIVFAQLSFKQLVEQSKSVGVHVAKFIGDTFFDVIRGIAKALDFVTNAAADSLKKLPSDTARKLADEIRTNLASKVPTEVLAQATKDVDQQLGQANAAVLTFLAGVKDEWRDAFKGVNDEIKGFFDEADARAAERKKKRDADAAAARAKEIKDEGDKQKKLQEQQDASIAALIAGREKIAAHKSEDLAKEENALQLAIVEAQFKARRIALEDYLDKKQALERADFQREIDNIDATTAALKAKLVNTKGDVNVETKINELLERREILQVKLAQLAVQQTQDANEAFDAEQDRLRQFKEDIEQRRAATSTDPAARAAADARKEEFDQLSEIIKLTREGASVQEIVAVQEVQSLEKIANARERVSKLAKDYHDKISEQQSFLNTEVKETQELLERGLIGQEEANRRNAEAFAAFKDNADAAIAKLKELEATATDPEVRARIQQQILEIGQSVREMAIATESSAVKLARSLRDDTQRSFGDFFSSLISGAVTVKSAFASLVGSIGKQMTDLVGSAIAKKFVLLLGGGGEGTGGIFGFLGRTLKFAAGGLVPGEGPPVDAVPAMLTPGEYVARQRAVQHYGVDFFDAVNQLMIPRDVASRFKAPGSVHVKHFASGGEVGKSAFPSASGLTRTAVVAGEQEFDAIIAGGRSALIRFFGQHRDTINGILARP